MGRGEHLGEFEALVLTAVVGAGRPRRFYRSAPDGVRALPDFREMWRSVWSGLELPDPEVLS